MCVFSVVYTKHDVFHAVEFCKDHARDGASDAIQYRNG